LNQVVDRFTPLLYAVARSHPDVVVFLLDRGADHTVRADGASALHLAALLGDLESARALLDRGADLHAVNPQGGTPLRSAADQGRTEMVRFLLERGARPDTVDSFGLRAIDYARQNGHWEVVRLLESH
jgi:ankyrin repeat protein